MDVEEEVSKVKRKLEKVMKGGKTSEPTIDLLKKLQSLPITLEILTKTRIGMTVNSLRKTAGEESVQSTAKTLIKDWKKFIAPSKDSGVTPASEENSREASETMKSPSDQRTCRRQRRTTEASIAAVTVRPDRF